MTYTSCKKLESKNDKEKYIGKVFSSNNYGDYEVIGVYNKTYYKQKRYIIRFLRTNNLTTVLALSISTGRISEEPKDKCDYCGVKSPDTHRVCYSKLYGGFLCNRHYLQMKKFNKLYRTAYDKNEYVTCSDHVEIILYSRPKIGENAKEIARTKIDIKNVELCKKYKWGLNSCGYVITTIKNKSIGLHRLILGIKNGISIDHIDRDPLNNKENNLRFANMSEQNINKNKRPDNTSGFIGVYFVKSRGTWLAMLNNEYKNYRFGTYKNKEDAIRARLNGELKYFGLEFAPQKNLFEEYGIGIDE